jgi:hypothetical protein
MPANELLAESVTQQTPLPCPTRRLGRLSRTEGSRTPSPSAPRQPPDDVGPSTAEYDGIDMRLYQKYSVLFTLPTFFELLRCWYAADDAPDESARCGPETGAQLVQVST